MKGGMTFFTIFISIFFAIGIGMLIFGLSSFFKGRAALSWSQATGEVTKCQIEEDSDGEGTTWKVLVGYRYSVNGQEYTGDRLAFGYSANSTQDEHVAIHKKIRGADSIRIYYDPANPAKSVIAPGFNRGTFLILVFAATWLLFITGFTMLWVSSSGEDTKILDKIEVVE